LLNGTDIFFSLLGIQTGNLSVIGPMLLHLHLHLSHLADALIQSDLQIGARLPAAQLYNIDVLENYN
jgi:hypothetical protein